MNDRASPLARQATTATEGAAGGARCTAGDGMAADSDDSMWQQDAAAPTVAGPEEAGPWQQLAEPLDSPGSTGPRWQKQSPAEAFSNARTSMAEPSERSRRFIGYPSA